MTPVFLDTVGLLALWDEADQWHADAIRAQQALEAIGAQLFTSNYILLECGNAAARKPFRNQVDDLRLAMAAVGQLIAPTEDDWHEAWRAFRDNRHAGAGIVDHFSFCAMRRLNIQKAFTNDRHFEAAGFEILF